MFRSAISILVLCALSIGVLAHPRGPPPEVKAAMEKCIKEAGGDESTLTAIRRYEEFTDPKFKCVASCIMKELGEMNADGTINKDKTFEKLPADFPNRDKIIEDLTPCYEKKGADDCETGDLIFKCVLEKMPRRHPH